MPVVSFSGLASGIDADGVINAVIEARRLAEVPLQNKVSTNDAENTALQEFNTKLLTLNDAVGKFLTLKGGGVSKTAASSNGDAVSAFAENSVAVSSLSVDVSQLARAATLSFDSRFASSDSPLAPDLSGPTQMQFTIGSGAAAQTVSVDITATTTLDELATAITAAAPGALQASVANAGTEDAPQFLLMVNGTQIGATNGSLSVSVPPELSGAGLFPSYQLIQAQDAVFSISGIGTVTRSSNTVSDVIPGLSLDLKQAGAGPVLISISSDASATAEKVDEFVTALNEIIKYSSDNSNIDRQEGDNGNDVTNVYGSLAHTRLDEQAIADIRQALSSTKSGIEGSEIQILADLGITTERDGTLAFDQAKFSEAVSKSPSAVNEILRKAADSLGATGGVIAQYTQFNGRIDNALAGNDSETESTNNALARMERNVSAEEDRLRKIFTNLEQSISQLNSQSSAIVSLLSSSGGR